MSPPSLQPAGDDDGSAAITERCTPHRPQQRRTHATADESVAVHDGYSATDD